MPDIHTIRLRHPWQCEPCAKGTRWLRSFNWPAGLTPREVARLVIIPLPASATVLLGGKPLVEESAGQFDITQLITESNQLAIEVGGSSPADGSPCPFDVRLEIVEG